MLEFERGERAGLVAAEPGEGDDGADIGATGRQGVDLVLKREVLPLDADEGEITA